MISIREVKTDEKDTVNDIVEIHLNTFKGFFLTFMGRGFLKQMYSSYCEHEESGLLVAEENGSVVGFLAYSGDFSGLYKFMIKTRLIQFVWFSMGAFFRCPKSFMHIIRAFLKPNEVKREENYIELSSIGVAPSIKNNGIGSQLIDNLKEKVNFNKFAYITLETDVINNDNVIRFYEKNGFMRERMFETESGRKMFEYRFVGEKNG